MPGPDSPPALRTQDVTGLILAGGRGARMNEADKGLALLQGEPMVAHVARCLAPQVGRVLVSANRNQDRYAAYGEVVGDDAGLGAWQGPLAGVAAGLAHCATPWLASVPCDTPFVPDTLVARLLGAAVRAGAPLAVACAGHRRHSASMVLHAALLPDLRAYLSGGDRKVGLWQARVGGVEVPFDDIPTAFLNVNTPEDLAQAVRYASQWRKS